MPTHPDHSTSPSNLPVEIQLPGDNFPVPGSQNVLQTLPNTQSLTRESCRDLDLEEGIHPAAIDNFNLDKKKSGYQLLQLLGAVAAFLACLYLFFPWQRIIPKAPQRLSNLLPEEVTPDSLNPYATSIYEIQKLYNEGELHTAKSKCEELIIDWENWPDQNLATNLWLYYLLMLNNLQEYHSLLQASQQIKQKKPDFKEATLYEHKANLVLLPIKNKYDKKDQAKNLPVLDIARRDCQIAIEALLINTSANNQKLTHQFQLLLADIYHWKWRLNNFNWNDEDRELAFACLRQLPENSCEAIEKHRALLIDCDKHWRKFWQWQPSIREIDAQKMSRKELIQAIKYDTNRLAKEKKT